MTSLPSWFDPVAPVVEALALLLHPHGEIVLHDLERDRVLAVWNGSSNRRPGDDSLLSELPAGDDGSVALGPYERVTIDGRRTTSVSAILSDAGGTPRGVLCVNLDRSPVDQAIAALAALAPVPAEPRPAVLFDRDWREQIALVVDTWCRERHLTRDALTREQRLAVVRELWEADLFATRGATQHVATALRVSRATVYTLLNEAKTAS
ncbi:helix-turn-helix transcriptional regulator [Umezawaea tangerina]|uniref:Putative transcriptional regulator YheO n=1 Tax=Umezawaea tangerina TaxID=84725 RepID=A0A2T0T287_9PSEU|nr:PAS domain-containing protein [Umezawaea tangerina]PRY39795.1 putative transcriptional regulator YheO [Umezawaea tangerina]